MAKNTNLDKEMEEEMEGVEDSDGSEDEDSGRKRLHFQPKHLVYANSSFIHAYVSSDTALLGINNESKRLILEDQN